MLSELHIRNFIIIDELNVQFGPGFNVLTGETGAGKSIIIDAIDLLLGGKARPDLIRSGTEEASVAAVFDISRQPTICRDLYEAGLQDGEELLVRRVITRTGKNRIFLNGVPITVSQLQGYLARLVTIYGQHEQQGLIRSDNHIQLLDRFAGIEFLFDSYRNIYSELRSIESGLQELTNAGRERSQRLDLLAFQRREIDAAGLRSGEEDELLSERAVLQHAERLNAVAVGGYQNLYSEDGAICGRLAVVATALRELAKIDHQLVAIAEDLQSAYYTLEDAALQLRDYASKISLEPMRLDLVEQRLGLLSDLKRKYGVDIDSVLAYRSEAEEEWLKLTNIDDQRSSLLTERERKQAELRRIGCELSALRRSSAVDLQVKVEHELQQLAMPKARFEVMFTALSEPGPRGLERVEFFLQANPGEEAKPLARVASGGELSRLMLAINRAAPSGENINTLIFDEVDAGIGGEAATAVGEKLHAVAQQHQVLCITHLPQVAAFAQQHFQVVKEEVGDGRIRTQIARLSMQNRVTEVARMLGGAKITPQTIAHAEELIRLSTNID